MSAARPQWADEASKRAIKYLPEGCPELGHADISQEMFEAHPFLADIIERFLDARMQYPEDINALFHVIARQDSALHAVCQRLVVVEHEKGWK